MEEEEGWSLAIVSLSLSLSPDREEMVKGVTGLGPITGLNLLLQIGKNRNY